MGNGPDVFMIVVLVFLALAGGLIWLSYQQRKKAREAARAFAQARGWTFTPDAPQLSQRWRSEPFGRGHSRRSSNAVAGTFHGRHVVSFEYQYTVGSGKNRSTYFYHVVALSLPAALPWLQLTRDGAGAAVAKFFGGQDIRFESKSFNDAWRVRGPEGQYPYDFIHPRMMDRLMAPDALGKSITVEGSDIFVWVSGRQVLEAIDVYANLLYGIYDLVPRHLWLRVGHDPATERR
ncbi:hypothetical protein [Actinotalea caeni]|uniref:hypothetical protein n=1 Tax=Actinotalea caeni TaxID=1348467 RepID=UPI0012E115C9|nr:hypothetical protein [Actinotalea caeni]